MHSSNLIMTAASRRAETNTYPSKNCLASVSKQLRNSSRSEASPQLRGATNCVRYTALPVGEASVDEIMNGLNEAWPSSGQGDIGLPSGEASAAPSLKGLKEALPSTEGLKEALLLTEKGELGLESGEARREIGELKPVPTERKEAAGLATAPHKQLSCAAVPLREVKKPEDEASGSTGSPVSDSLKGVIDAGDEPESTSACTPDGNLTTNGAASIATNRLPC